MSYIYEALGEKEQAKQYAEEAFAIIKIYYSSQHYYYINSEKQLF